MSIEERKETIARKIADLLSLHEKISSALERSKTMSDITNKRCTDIKSDINTEAEKLHKLIDEEKKKLIGQVDNFAEKKTSTIHKFQKELETIESLTTDIEQIKPSAHFEIIESCASRLMTSMKDLNLDPDEILFTEITWTPTENHERFPNIASLGSLQKGKEHQH